MKAIHIDGRVHTKGSVALRKREAHGQGRSLYVSHDPTCRPSARFYQVDQIAQYRWYTKGRELVMRGGKARPVLHYRKCACRIVSHDRAYLYGGTTLSFYTVAGSDGRTRKWVDTGRLRE